MRLLLITRHYPPAVSGGAKRPSSLARALRKHGAEVFVVAPSLPDGEPGIAVPHPNRDPSGAASSAPSLRDLGREWLLWPDPDIRWSMRAARAAAEGAPWKPDWIWTTSPSESVHAAGAKLRQQLDARWLMDFRDHWLERPHRRQRLAAHRQFGEGMLARRWLRNADLVTCVDASIQAELARLGARDARVLPHFMPDGRGADVALPANDINIVHTGSIALSDPEARIEDLLAVFAGAQCRNANLRLHLVGRLTDEEQSKVAQSAAVARISVHGVLPLEQSLGFQRAADALVLVGSAKTHVPPSKITEYLATTAPIIACGPGDWRNDPRLDDADPVEALAGLRKGDLRKHSATAPDLDHTARELLSWLSVAQ